MHTEICDRLGIEFPIFAFSHCRDVVAAVTSAGGFGVLGAARQPAVACGPPSRLVASALGPPPASLVSRAHAHGAVVAALVGTAEHARRQQAAGADLIVAQGTEAGGHTGTVSTMVLVPEVIRAVSPTPVLAAGGIVTGAQIAAAMALGGQGVGLLDKARPARQVVEQMVTDYLAVAERFAAQLEV